MDNHKAEEEIEINQIINKMMLKNQEVIEVTEEIGKKTITKQEDLKIMGIDTIMTEEIEVEEVEEKEMEGKNKDQEILEEEGEEEVIGPTIEIIIIDKDKKIKKDQTILIGICRMEILEENNMIIIEVTTNRIDLQGTITIIIQIAIETTIIETKIATIRIK
jgi:hypothetical protein